MDYPQAARVSSRDVQTAAIRRPGLRRWVPCWLGCTLLLSTGPQLSVAADGVQIEGTLAAALDVIGETPESEVETIGPAYTTVRLRKDEALAFALGVLKSPRSASPSTLDSTPYLRAKAVFEALGTNLPPGLISELTPLYNDERSAPVVGYALTKLGEPGGAALLAGLAHTNNVVRFASCNWIPSAQLGTNETAVVRTLGGLAATDVDINIRTIATTTLGAVQARGDEVERLLLSLATNSDDRMYQRLVLKALSKKAPLSAATREGLQTLYLGGQRGDELKRRAEQLLGSPGR